MRKIASNTNQYLVVLIGLAFFILGGFVLTRVVSVDNMTLWLPISLVLAGLLILPASSEASKDGGIRSAALTIAFILILIGCHLALRITGIVNTPFLQYILGGGFCLVGLYGLISGLLRINRTPV